MEGKARQGGSPTGRAGAGAGAGAGNLPPGSASRPSFIWPTSHPSTVLVLPTAHVGHGPWRGRGQPGDDGRVAGCACCCWRWNFPIWVGLCATQVHATQVHAGPADSRTAGCRRPLGCCMLHGKREGKKRQPPAASGEAKPANGVAVGRSRIASEAVSTCLTLPAELLLMRCTRPSRRPARSG